MAEIILAKLVSGEVIVAKIKKSNPDYIEDTFLVNFSPSQDGRIGIDLIPYMYPFEQIGATIPIEKVLYKALIIPAELESAYVSVSSGIIINPTKNDTPPDLKLM